MYLIYGEWLTERNVRLIGCVICLATWTVWAVWAACAGCVNSGICLNESYLIFCYEGGEIGEQYYSGMR